MVKKCSKKNVMKIIALFIIVAIVFVIWKEPILSKASSYNNEESPTEVEEVVEDESTKNFKVYLEDSSYVEYTITDQDVTCDYYEYVGTEDGEESYEMKTSTVEITSVERASRGLINQPSEGPLYWKKSVKDKLKKDYFYQPGIKGTDVYYKIGWEEQPYVINYTQLEDKRDVDAYINLLDDINKQIMTCLAVAVGAVMVAIAAIIASYITIGAKDCLTAVSAILNKCGVTLLQLSPLSFGRMVFKLYDDYVELEKKFALAATYGTPEMVI